MIEQVLKNTQASLAITFSAGAADAAVTVTTTRADGTAGPSGTAVHGTGGDYTFTLVPQTELDILTVKWAGSWGTVAQSLTTTAEIVGDYLFSLSDLRNFGDKTLTDTTKYPDGDLRNKRDEITDFFEQVCRVSFVPRYWRELLDGTGSRNLFALKKPVRRVISATIDGAAVPDLATIKPWLTGKIERFAAVWQYTRPQGVAIAYEHGFAAPPARVSRAAMTLARYELVSNDISDRMIAFNNDLGSIRLSVPGRDYPTGIPIVDATLAYYSQNELFGP